MEPLDRVPPVEPLNQEYQVPDQLKSLFTWIEEYKKFLLQYYTLSTTSPESLISLYKVELPRLGDDLLYYIKTRDGTSFSGPFLQDPRFTVLKGNLDEILASTEWSPDLTTHSRSFIDFFFKGGFSLNPALMNQQEAEKRRVLLNSGLPVENGRSF